MYMLLGGRGRVKRASRYATHPGNYEKIRISCAFQSKLWHPRVVHVSSLALSSFLMFFFSFTFSTELESHES